MGRIVEGQSSLQPHPTQWAAVGNLWYTWPMPFRYLIVILVFVAAAGWFIIDQYLQYQREQLLIMSEIVNDGTMHLSDRQRMLSDQQENE